MNDSDLLDVAEHFLPYFAYSPRSGFTRHATVGAAEEAARSAMALQELAGETGESLPMVASAFWGRIWGLECREGASLRAKKNQVFEIQGSEAYPQLQLL